MLLQVTQAFGANRWDTAQFSDDKEKDKFIKLMASAPCHGPACPIN